MATAAPEISTVGSRPRLSAWQDVTLTVLLTLMGLFYMWTATTSNVFIEPAAKLPGYFPEIARSFLAGHLYLTVQPKPELLALPDPYDPAQNQRYKVHDAILFNKRYYVYYGVAPVLMLFLPFRAATGLDFPEALAVPLFCTIALVSAFGVLRFLADRYLPHPPFWLLLASILALAFGSQFPYLIRRPMHYELAIAAGQGLVFAAAFFYVIGTLGERLRLGYVLAGSILLGLAVGSRFPLLSAGIIPAALAACTLYQRRQEPWRRHLITLLAFFGPVAVCVFLVGLYNYLRFDSWTQFGLTYTLQGWKSARTYKFIDIAHVPPGLFYYLLCPPHYIAEFPFIYLDPTHYLKPPENYWVEPIGGILPLVPLVGILLFLPAALVAFWKTHRELCLAIMVILVPGCAMFTLYVLWAAIPRYENDFATFWLIAALWLWFLVIQSLGPKTWKRRAVVSVFVMLLAVTVVTNAATSIIGLGDNLRYGSPMIYNAVHDWFRPIERLLSAL
jgi:hypothetical protein